VSITPLELYVIGRNLELSGWTWETWSGSFEDGSAKGWWFQPGASGAKAVRRGDPKPYDLATISTWKLYVEA